MKVYKLRSVIQFISFTVLTYGTYLGLNVGHFFPCFSCPYVHGCPGDCYLMALQRSQWGFEMPISEFFTAWGVRALGMFLGFLLLVILLSKVWCGWICPFGTLQDVIAWFRKKLAIRESIFSSNTRNKIKSIKYVVLFLLILVPFLIANAGLHPDFSLFFCQICPAKPIMPVFEWNFRNLAVDLTNPITTVMTALSLIVAGVFLTAMFFKDRIFCMFCPMLALISLFDKLGFIRLKKKVAACTGCGNCQRMCPMDIREVHLEKVKENVLTQDCVLCLKCVEACPQDNALSVKFLNKTIFSSSKKYVSGLLRKEK